MYVLYSFPYSQHCRRVISLLEEAKLSYRIEHVDMMSGKHMSPDYLAINPNHQVPTLVGNTIKIHESNAILRYLCNKHKLTNWYPKDAEGKAAVDQWLDWIQCQMSPAVVNVVLNKVFMGEQGDKKAIELGLKQMLELNPILAIALEQSPYLTGDNPTIADLALISNIFHLAFAKELPAAQSILNWYNKMMSLEGVIKSLPKE